MNEQNTQAAARLADALARQADRDPHQRIASPVGAYCDGRLMVKGESARSRRRHPRPEPLPT